MKPQQIEQTAKRYKALIAIGGTLIVVGFSGLIFTAAAGFENRVSGNLIFFGVLIYAFGRFAAWWNNG